MKTSSFGMTGIGLFLGASLAAITLPAPSLLQAQAAGGGSPDKPVAIQATTTPAQASAEADKPGTVTATVAGREIQVTAPETTPTINVVGPRAEVRVGSHLVVVEKDQLIVDGKSPAQLPADSRQVEVILSKGALTVKADGKEVLQTANTPEGVR